MEFNEIKKAYIELTAFAKESLRKSLQENKADTAKYLSGYLDGLYMMYREVEVELEGSEEALEKQIPKKPDVGEVLGYEGFSGYLCPICHNWLLCSDDTPTSRHSFCSSCGQKIDWQR